MISSTWSLEHGLEMVVAKMRDMTVKDTRNDRHFKKAGFGEIGWGGGKGMVWHSGPGAPTQAELDVVGEVLKFGGAHVGGNDEGNRKEQGGMISNKAPAQFAGSERAHEKMRGIFPSPQTAIGNRVVKINTVGSKSSVDGLYFFSNPHLRCNHHRFIGGVGNNGKTSFSKSFVTDIGAFSHIQCLRSIFKPRISHI